MVAGTLAFGGINLALLLLLIGIDSCVSVAVSFSFNPILFNAILDLTSFGVIFGTEGIVCGRA